MAAGDRVVGTVKRVSSLSWGRGWLSAAPGCPAYKVAADDRAAGTVSAVSFDRLYIHEAQLSAACVPTAEKVPPVPPCSNAERSCTTSKVLAPILANQGKQGGGACGRDGGAGGGRFGCFWEGCGDCRSRFGCSCGLGLGLECRWCHVRARGRHFRADCGPCEQLYGAATPALTESHGTHIVVVVSNVFESPSASGRRGGHEIGAHDDEGFRCFY